MCCQCQSQILRLSAFVYTCLYYAPVNSEAFFVFTITMGKNKPKNPSTVEKLKERKKQWKQLMKEKRARLVVRNLPFTTTKENLLEHYQKFGDVKEVTLLRKPDGTLIGVGFVQFKLVQKAAKARFHTNGKPFLGRDIICEFAKPKDKYVKASNKKKEPEKVEIKEEPMDSDEVEVKTEPIGDEDVSNVETKPDESDHDEDEQVHEVQLDEVNAMEEEDSSEDSENEDEEEDIVEVQPEVEEKKRHVIWSDISEGKTVFVKGIPFAATNDDLRECMSQFGPLYYVLICFDKLTEHSKGSGFVKFRNQEDAEKCLQAGTELKLFENILDCHKALSRNELQSKAKEKTEIKHKDSRNLYLIKEGVVLAGSKAAEGVSAADMAKRLQLEQYKSQMLKNLNMFISNNRLIIHNVPASWDDSKLRALFVRHIDKTAIIKEARIMRDLRNLDERGVGRSKEYGFVSFTRHENALQALRSLNNNPNIFSDSKRPIVAFSIENRAVIKAKEKRLNNSRLKNPKHKIYNPEPAKSEPKPQQNAHKRKYPTNKPNTTTHERSQFEGVAATPGIKKMRSRYNLKAQAQLHHETLKKEKKKQKFAKKSLAEKRKEFIRQPQQKVNKNPKTMKDDGFAKLVNSYKEKLLNASASTKTKWYV